MARLLFKKTDLRHTSTSNKGRQDNENSDQFITAAHLPYWTPSPFNCQGYPGHLGGQKKEVYIGISKKSHLMDKIESVIRQMIEAGEIKKIIIAYYTQRNLPVPAH